MSRTRSAASTEKPMRRAVAAGTDLPSHAWTNSSADLSVHSTATGTHTLLLYLHILTQQRGDMQPRTAALQALQMSEYLIKLAAASTTMHSIALGAQR